MNHLKDFEPIIGDFIQCVVEIPKGSSVKYEIEPTKGEVVTPVRELARNYKYPFNYGFIPKTLEQDGDPMDVCIIGCDRLEPLTHVLCRVLGCFKTVDNGEQDDKIIVTPYYVTKSKKLAKDVWDAFHFLKKYKYPYQKDTVVDGTFYTSQDASILINEAIKRVNSKNNSESKVTLS